MKIFQLEHYHNQDKKKLLAISRVLSFRVESRNLSVAVAKKIIIMFLCLIGNVKTSPVLDEKLQTLVATRFAESEVPFLRFVISCSGWSIFGSQKNR